VNPVLHPRVWGVMSAPWADLTPAWFPVPVNPWHDRLTAAFGVSVHPHADGPPKHPRALPKGAPDLMERCVDP
jgi:hypothetical protein